jgi:hypothetical protein
MAEEENLEALIGRIPAGCSTKPDLHCCCGRTDCAYLKHNNSALDDLEKEVKTAAQLGQVCHIPPCIWWKLEGFFGIYAYYIPSAVVKDALDCREHVRGRKGRADVRFAGFAGET